MGRLGVFSVGLAAAALAAVLGAAAQVGPSVAASAPASAAYGVWTPSPHDTCTKTQHDAYFVIGPDGKTYPTWHPPIDPLTGCSFGHEHGRDPRLSMLWQTKQIQRYFYFDANQNGVMDPEEEAVTGIPFGYAAEKTNDFFAAQGLPSHRHEDHVGHKIEWANGEPDSGTHQMSTDPTGGVWVGKLGNGIVQADTGVRCFYLSKAHQGVNSADAFTNNLHEVFYFADCRAPNPAQNQQVSLALMVPFGKPGEFTQFQPMCGGSARGDAAPQIVLGTDATNQYYPAWYGNREIITRECVEKGFLVGTGTFSGNFYEAWSGVLGIYDATGRMVAGQVALLFDVEDAARYYYPEATKALRGYSNPVAGPNRGFSMDLCYDTSLIRQGRQARGGVCDTATDYGRITNIAWDDPRSGFRGLHRGMYFKPAVLDNAPGPSTWYSDPFGGRGQATPFVGSIRQFISAAQVNYSTLIDGLPIDPRVVARVHDDGNGHVHAPN